MELGLTLPFVGAGRFRPDRGVYFMNLEKLKAYTAFRTIILLPKAKSISLFLILEMSLAYVGIILFY